MKIMQQTLLAALLFSLALPVFSASAPSEPGKPASHSPNTGPAAGKTLPAITVKDIMKLSPREFEKLTGKKLKLKDRIAYKILQWKLRKQYREGEPTTRQRKQGTLSLIFGAAALGLLFIPATIAGLLSLGLAVGGLVLGLKSIKGNSNAAGLIGLILSSIVLFLFILAVIVVASWDWN